jgi:hypothetical protein
MALVQAAVAMKKRTAATVASKIEQTAAPNDSNPKMLEKCHV